MTDLIALRAANEKRWANAKVTRQGSFGVVAKHLVDAKQRYQTVALKTGVPWFVIAVIHERESSQNWASNIAQGDPWNRESVHVPAGRGPFKSWEEAAIDALTNCGPYLARNKDWSVGGTLLRLEQYNGLGYASRGVPSPYLWAGTNQYVSGKYVSDGVYSPSAVDQQLGCAGLLLAMMVLDPTITFTGAVLTPPANQSTPKPVQSTPSPSISNPAKGSIGAFVASLLSSFLSLFKRK